MRHRPEQLLSNEVMAVVANSLLLSRAALLNSTLLDAPGRDLDKECGYPLGELDAFTYYRLYERVGIAQRVVNVYPVESWSVLPEVYEIEEEVATPFEQEWDKLLKRRQVWNYLNRIDELSGIGRYGVLLLGFSDGGDLSEPVPGIGDDGRMTKARQEGNELLYLRTFDESKVSISSYETDVRNPRYGEPTMYKIAFVNPVVSGPGPDQQQGHGTNSNIELDVHWSRCLHIADNRKSSEVFGTPRMRPVIPEIYDVRKIRGGSAEMFWRGAFPGYSFESYPELGIEVEIDQESVKDVFEQYANGLKRYMALAGVRAKSLAPQIANPTNHLTQQYFSICATLGVPMRVFIGSQSGHLASTIDTETWYRRLINRQSMYISPMIIEPFIDRLITVGALPLAPSGFTVIWGGLSSISGKDKADVSLKRTQALMQYVAGGVEQVMTPLDYLTKILELSVEEANVIVKRASRKGRKLLTKQKGQVQPQVSTQGSGGRIGNPGTADEGNPGTGNMPGTT